MDDFDLNDLTDELLLLGPRRRVATNREVRYKNGDGVEGAIVPRT